MDPLTHVIVGAAVAVIGGAEVSIADPVLIAVVLGAVSPDLDIVYQYWGHYAYLKHHRGFSHSIPGLLGFAGIIGLIMTLVFPQTGFWTFFLWSFIGALSHSLMDLLNSYGVMLFYPFSKKKYTLNLLMITDPVFVAGNIGIIYAGYENNGWLWPIVVVTGVYLFFRLLMRRRAERLIRKYYGVHVEKLVVMPSFIGLFKWDFIVRVNKKNIVGQLNLVTCRLQIHQRLKLATEEIAEKLERTKIGKIFKEFTPFCHIHCEEQDDKLIGRFIDMRYYVRNSFLHHATVIMDKEKDMVEKALFQPYSLKNQIEIS